MEEMKGSPSTVAIVPAAGRGKRLGLGVPKPFVLLRGKPIIIRTLEAFESSGEIDAIILAVERPRIGEAGRLLKRYRIGKVAAIVAGGATRFESVRNCLEALDKSVKMVLIHDGARPFVDKKIIKDSIRLARRYGACVVAVPEKDTVKVLDKDLFIGRTLDRRKVYRALTPQVFRREILARAYLRPPINGATDDSSLAEAQGIKVKVLVGSYKNIKITTREDLKTAEVFL